MTGLPGKSQVNMYTLCHLVRSVFALHSMGCYGPMVHVQTVKTDQPGHMYRLFALGAHIILLTHFILNDLKWSENAIRSALNLSFATIYVRHANKHQMLSSPLRKHAYLNILKILHILAQNIDCGYSLEPPRWSGSNEYPQSMFLSRNKKNNVYPCKPQFYYIKVGFKEVESIYMCFRDD